MKKDVVWKKVIQIVGVAAIVAIPFFILCKKCKAQEVLITDDDNNNVFSEELYG